MVTDAECIYLPQMPSHRGPLLSLLVVSTPLLAQEQPTIGRFLTADGTAIAGAVVTFATSRQDVFDALAPARVVTATTDARGAFRVVLQQGDVHSLWAIGPEGEAECVCSPVHEGVRAGSVLELRATARTKPTRLRVALPEELGDGPFTLEVFLAARHAPSLRLPLPADGLVTLPALPPGQAVLRLLDTDGRVVVGWFWPNGEKTQPASVRRRLVEVVDETGAPVVGARVAALTNAAIPSSLFGTSRVVDSVIEGPPTDEAGRSVMVLAEHYVVGFVAWTDERVARLANDRPRIVDGVPQDPSSETASDDAAPIRLVARTAPRLRGTLRRGDTPLANLRITAQVDGECRREEGGISSASGFSASHATDTDAAGRFAIPGVVRPMRSLRLALDLGDGVPTYPLPRADVPAEPLDLDVATWPLLTLRLRTTGANPPAACHYLLWPATSERETAPLLLVGERSGRVRARFEPGEWFVFATDGDACAVQLVDVPAGASAEIDLPSQALPRMRGLAHDAEGRPAANARFQVDGWKSERALSFPFETWRQQDAATVARLDRLLKARVITIHRGLVNAQRTDAEGRFSVPLLPMHGGAMTGTLNGFLGLEVEFRPAEDLDLQLQR